MCHAKHSHKGEGGGGDFLSTSRNPYDLDFKEWDILDQKDHVIRIKSSTFLGKIPYLKQSADFGSNHYLVKADVRLKSKRHYGNQYSQCTHKRFDAQQLGDHASEYVSSNKDLNQRNTNLDTK